MNENDIFTLEFDDLSYKMYLPFAKTDLIQRHIFNTKKPYEYEMLTHIRSQLKSGDTIMDIGMNIANHSLFFLACGFKVLGFEANAKMIDLAKKSLNLNNGFSQNIEIFELGVSDREEKAFYAQEKPGNYGAMNLSIDNERTENFIICKSIDSLNISQKIALMKIDIEGMETKALRGAKALIAKNRPIIYAEANFVGDFLKIDEVLLEYDYIHYGIFGDSPTHLYYPREKIPTEKIGAKMLSNTALMRLYFTNYKHNNLIHNSLARNTNEIVAVKNQLLALQNELVGFKNELSQEQNLKGQLKLSEKRLNHYQNMLSYRFGQSLITSFKNPLKFLLLPFRLFKDYKEYKKYMEQKG